ncbi:hypothetical protein NDU88_000837 [Pleurodeles waltl]|uniref:Uncharacterized protein n=1 Tax=Pleurodeles waltl TaxID=8319 RepID=A0AAV7TGK5_PLEWA|nr:hypothetical protein NDU88_000837 [Pleurodeles waltl]
MESPTREARWSKRRGPRPGAGEQWRETPVDGPDDSGWRNRSSQREVAQTEATVWDIGLAKCDFLHLAEINGETGGLPVIFIGRVTSLVYVVSDVTGEGEIKALEGLGIVTVGDMFEEGKLRGWEKVQRDWA